MQSEYDRLNRLSDPARFPTGPNETRPICDVSALQIGVLDGRLRKRIVSKTGVSSRAAQSNYLVIANPLGPVWQTLPANEDVHFCCEISAGPVVSAIQVPHPGEPHI